MSNPRLSFTVAVTPSRLLAFSVFVSKRTLAMTIPCAPAAETEAPARVLITLETDLSGNVLV